MFLLNLRKQLNLQILNVFKHDADYEENEQKYGAIKTELLGDDSGNY